MLYRQCASCRGLGLDPPPVLQALTPLLIVHLTRREGGCNPLLWSLD
jgi:hypothetical protein